MADEKKDTKTETKTEKKDVKKSTKKRYTPKEKDKLLARYKKLRESGMKAAEASSRVGVPYITLQTWIKAETKPAPKKAKKQTKKKQTKKAAPKKKFRVKKVPVASNGVFTLVLPSGMRVECPSANDVAAVVRGLS